MSGVCIARARAEKLGSLKSKPPRPPVAAAAGSLAIAGHRTTRGNITHKHVPAHGPPRDTYCDLWHCYRPPNGVHYLDCDACCAG